MKLLAFFFVLVTFVAGLPIVESGPGDIVRSDDPFPPRPIGDRPVEPHPVEPRPVEPRPIGSNPIIPRTLESRQTIPNAYIIEFKDNYTHDDFQSYMAAHSVTYTIRVTYDYPGIFVGYSVQLKNGGDYEMLKSWKGVKNIWPVQQYEIPPIPEAGQPRPTASTASVSA